jgi:serine/threonine protein kinase
MARKLFSLILIPNPNFFHRHPSVIAYKEAFFEENSSILCIVMELADGGDLYQRIIEHQKKGTFF